jgi:hypothetical protein
MTTETKAPKYVIAPEGCADYLTAGKRYPVFSHNKIAFDTEDDSGRMIGTQFLKSAHLNGGDWIIPDEAEATPDADGWIEWAGGECPVAPGVLVEVRYRGSRKPETGPWETETGPGETFGECWQDDDYAEDIIAYRIVSPAPQPDGNVHFVPDDRRFVAAVAAMQGIMANERMNYYSAGHEQRETVARCAVAQADALLAALGGE